MENNTEDTINEESDEEPRKSGTNPELLAYMSRAFNVSRDDDDYRDDDDSSSTGSAGEGTSDSSFSSSFSGTTNNEASQSDHRTIGEETKLLTEEGGMVKRSKVIIFFCILAAAVASALATTYLVKRNEKDVYHDRAKSFGHEIANRSQQTFNDALKALESLGRTVSSLVNIESAANDPAFVTIPHFEIYGKEALEAAKADVIIFSPRVRDADKLAWESYSQDHQSWIIDALEYEGSNITDPGRIPTTMYTRNKPHDHAKDGLDVHMSGYHFPIWQMTTAPRNASIINLDLMADNRRMEHDMIDVGERRKPLLSSIQDLRYLTEYSRDTKYVDEKTNWINAQNLTIDLKKLDPLSKSEQPQQSYILYPIFDSIEAYFSGNGHDELIRSTRDTSTKPAIVGFLVAVFNWKSIFEDILPDGLVGMTVVVKDGCGRVMTYMINGKKVEYLGRGDLHNRGYDMDVITVNDFGGLAAAGFESLSIFHPDPNGTEYNEHFKDTPRGHCEFSLEIYPSSAFEALYSFDVQAIYISVIVVLFVIIVALLFVYDLMVIARQRRLMFIAQQTSTLISSLFPKEIQKRILENAARNEKMQLLSGEEYEAVLGDESQAQSEYHTKAEVRTTKAIADYFPSATIFFADIVGFTAWSSTRDPSQVFELLETLYHDFDQLAKKRRVFKVETVGDCYVAATGLPEARKDHAIVMARFARDILFRFGVLVKDLEEKLGPDTGDLALRVGLNSGPVTAGVLRGEKSRFQLFGDTVNTAARMESTGRPNRIHLSKETAEILMKAGKQKWVSPREEKVWAKGKGELQTYWLEVSRRSSSYTSESITSNGKPENIGMESLENILVPSTLEEQVVNPISEKLQRLVKWNSELLAKSLQLIIARRSSRFAPVADAKVMRELEKNSRTISRCGKLVFEEVVEIIPLPSKAETSALDDFPTNPDSVPLSPAVQSQLHDYVRTIAAMYRENNPFHNFEHASHVCMSTIKLLARIVAPHQASYGMKATEISENFDLHDNTYGITSDPLTQFAAVYSALIHDVDHPGVPNSTLVEEGDRLAVSYNNRSVAEQNSVDLAWDLLMQPDYEELRRVLYVNETEFKRFRQLVANMVMATDIMDKEMGAFRKARWNKVFDEDDESIMGSKETQHDINRKATIVLEHLIQASDVSHTMQHWHIYIKWNERFFQECYKAYKEGRAPKDPSENWYSGELGFFDFYIIPLAKKLESCGVFGVSSDEYLTYAMNNRSEWEHKGKEQVTKYIDNFNKRYGASAALPMPLVTQSEAESIESMEP